MDQKASICRMVVFVPPQECVGPQSLLKYPAIITKVTPANTLTESKQLFDHETVELATFGPNSLYFQHNVPFSQEEKPGHWSWPARN